MTKRDFALLAVRLLGLYVIATSFGALAWTFSVLNGPPSTAPTWQRWILGLAPFGFQTAFGMVLWMFASSLAYLMAGEDAERETIARWQPREVTRLGIVLFGLVSLLHGVQLAGQFVGQFAMFWGTPGTNSWAKPSLLAAAAGAVPLIFGLILLCGARFFSFWLAPHGDYYALTANEGGDDDQT